MAIIWVESKEEFLKLEYVNKSCENSMTCLPTYIL